ncbi:hypothetical protein ACB098_05G217400 [Castanea mollissima]
MNIMIDFIADYYQNIESYKVLSQVEPGYLKKLLPESAPYYPESIKTILQDIQKYIIPGFLVEILSTGFNVVGFNWMSSPVATELECIVIYWLGEMLMLPKSFLFKGNGGGVLQGTTCEAILCTLAAARDQMLNRYGSEKMEKLVVYGFDQTHSALQKAVQIARIHTKNFGASKTVKSNSFRLCPNSLRDAVHADVKAGLVPLFLCAIVGTTSTDAIDPIGPLYEVAKDFNICVHVDAAYAGSACICPMLAFAQSFVIFIDGIEGANSFTLNAHKWFLTTLDCCCLWVKDPSALIKSLSTKPEFLRDKATDSKLVVDYKDWQITLSRRFRAMKLWLVLRSYGVANLRNFLRSHVKMAKLFEELLRNDDRFEVVAPRNFALRNFRKQEREVLPWPNDNSVANQVECANELNKKLLESINGSGNVYMSSTMVDGAYIIRCAIGATLTEERHVIRAWKVIQEHADSLFSKK